MKFIKKHIKLLIFIIVIISIYFIYKLNNNNNLTYLSLGDGYAVGENSYKIIDYGYSDYLKDYLEENNQLQFYTKKFSNNKLMITNLYENIIINQKVIVEDKTINIKQSLRNSSIITLSIGINDLIYKLSLEEINIPISKINKIVIDTNKDFNILIKEIKKYYPYKIYVIGYQTVNIPNKNLLIAVKKLNYLYKQNKDIIYIDPNKVLIDKYKYFSNPNSMYPNKEGYKAISNEIVNNFK